MSNFLVFVYVVEMLVFDVDNSIFYKCFYLVKRFLKYFIEDIYDLYFLNVN